MWRCTVTIITMCMDRMGPCSRDWCPVGMIMPPMDMAMGMAMRITATCRPMMRIFRRLRRPYPQPALEITVMIEVSALFDDFIVRAGLAGLAVAVAAGPLGCFVIWRRMAYFGDALSHSALLGIALGTVLNVPVQATVVATGLAMAGFLTAFARQRRLGSDALLGIFSHAALSFGLIALAFLGAVRIDLHALLFGDILAVDRLDLLQVWLGCAVVLAVLAVVWRPLLAATVHRDLAQAEGLPVARAELAFMLLMALTIAVAVKIVGVMLITALLIIPAAAARGVSRTPEQMALLAAGVGVVSVSGGLGASLTWDLPTGPAIVATAALIFSATMVIRTSGKA